MIDFKSGKGDPAMCEKKPFETEQSAKRAAKGFAKMRGGSKQRPYFCDHCRSWHLTTQSPEQRKKRGKPYVRESKKGLRDGRDYWK